MEDSVVTYHHKPAMVPEVLEALNCRPGKIYVDGTLGGGGHAREMCLRIQPGGRIIGIDQDAMAVAAARRDHVLQSARIDLFHGSFSELPAVLNQLALPGVDGVLLDLGMSQYQIESSGRGFSFRRDEPLDMRMDVRRPLTAADLIQQSDAATLADLFHEYGEERYARKIAEAIVRSRLQQPITSSGALARLVVSAIPAAAIHRQKIHPATRVFMALRIAVNNEIEVLKAFLEVALACVLPGGRICVLAFHSLEDRLVKRSFFDWEKGCDCSKELPQCVCGKQAQGRRVVRKALRPRESEIKANPMVRSTRLRVFEKMRISTNRDLKHERA